MKPVIRKGLNRKWTLPLKTSIRTPNGRAIQIFGANTDVGKTIVSSLFCKVDPPEGTSIRYIKPVATGPEQTLDHVHIKRHANNVMVKCYQKYSQPWSPTRAAEWERNAARNADYSTGFRELDDSKMLKILADDLNRPGSYSIVETFGGVMSPLPSGRAQADFYRSFRLPIVLVGDSKLGGVSSTVSAFESLTLRGYDVEQLVFFGNEPHQNDRDVRTYLNLYGYSQLARNIIVLPPIPPQEQDTSRDAAIMDDYYNQIMRKGTHVHEIFTELLLCDKDAFRTSASSLRSRAASSIWHPFMQHKESEAADLLPIDSAYGDYFTLTKPAEKVSRTFDGSASWWTQGLGHGNPALSLAAAYAAGRYGHVMFAGAIHEPALELAETFLERLENARLQKVFFTDNGSTGIEVGIKMALKAAVKRYGFTGQQDSIEIIGLKGSYHGDTIGAMDCSEPSVFNTKTEWYRGRGYWFDYPSVGMKDGKWVVSPPKGMEAEFGPGETFDDLNQVFASRDPAVYEKYIDKVLDEEVNEKGRKFGALVMEPVLLGAGGMIFADPLFQSALVNAVRRRNFGKQELQSAFRDPYAWQGLPVVFDEVFTGLYRLGRFSAASFLGVKPDISVHAKLLTGGLLPLCLTLASNSIFEAFLGDEKSDALLHGHSYTAHAMGCTVAKKALWMMNDIQQQRATKLFKLSWARAARAIPSEPDRVNNLIVSRLPYERVWSHWHLEFVKLLSRQERVSSVVALGTVLAIKITDPEGSGYSSRAAVTLQNDLERSIRQPIHCRVLGNVLYVMASLTTQTSTMYHVQLAIARAFGIESEVRSMMVPTQGKSKDDVSPDVDTENDGHDADNKEGEMDIAADGKPGELKELEELNREA
ncbi:PLP-dependent transferase [Pseudovirgaria hyperparasitica]|uniref:PLP-dependent transferase n=1 Tax=Pseudovirgaria hyperparasitica TaxID=470096 RepID=A0A6A6VQS6_9PEZI|nr:PLP-dependent transferase [Pseudovirgaria hyperparasitica]KAF2753008.1 PLP-dependent transferase [Pseudovirgaria hyperparasitica]